MSGETSPKTSENKTSQLLKVHFLAWGALFLFVMKIAFSFTAFYIAERVYASGISTEELLQCTNYFRQQEDLPPLVLNPILSKAAMLKLEDMDQDDYWAHVNPKTGVQPWQFFDELSYQYSYAGENMAFDYNTSAGVCKGWMASAAHRDNLLDQNYLEVGFAVKRVDLGKYGEGNLVVQFFGTHQGLQITRRDQDKFKYRPKNFLCRSEILNKLKILSPNCGYYNESEIDIEAEILDDNYQDVFFRINENDIEGKLLEEGDNKVVQAVTTLEDGDYQIYATSANNNEEAMVSITVDTVSPQIPEDQIKIIRTEIDGRYVFDIELLIIDDNFSKAEIYYKDYVGESLTKPFQLLGSDIYHARISFPTDSKREQFEVSVLVLDRAQNSTNLSIDLFPETKERTPLLLTILNLDKIWKYILLFFSMTILAVYVFDIFILKNRRHKKELQHHNYLQLALFFFLTLSLFLSLF